MHDGRWGDDWGSGWWMAFMMVVGLAAVAWVIVALARRNSAPAYQSVVASPLTAPRPTPQEILAERLALGEIEPEDYSKRLAALSAERNS